MVRDDRIGDGVRMESGKLGEWKRHTRKIKLSFKCMDLEIPWDVQVGDVWNLSPRVLNSSTDSLANGGEG